VVTHAAYVVAFFALRIVTKWLQVFPVCACHSVRIVAHNFFSISNSSESGTNFFCFLPSSPITPTVFRTVMIWFYCHVYILH
jgi:hypothetical protein